MYSFQALVSAARAKQMYFKVEISQLSTNPKLFLNHYKNERNIRHILPLFTILSLAKMTLKKKDKNSQDHTFKHHLFALDSLHITTSPLNINNNTNNIAFLLIHCASSLCWFCCEIDHKATEQTNACSFGNELTPVQGKAL